MEPKLKSFSIRGDIAWGRAATHLLSGVIMITFQIVFGLPVLYNNLFGTFVFTLALLLFFLLPLTILGFHVAKSINRKYIIDYTQNTLTYFHKSEKRIIDLSTTRIAVFAPIKRHSIFHQYTKIAFYPRVGKKVEIYSVVAFVDDVIKPMSAETIERVKYPNPFWVW